jgi:putative membrane protein
MTSRRVFLVAFWVFTASIVFSILGTLALFIPPVAEFFRPYLGGLIRAPTWIYMGLLPVLSLALYWRELGPGRSVAFLAAGSVIGAAAELVGTQTGFPFGAYAYNHWLGPKIAGHVPYFIPPSWYALSIVCLDLARRFGLGRWGRVAATAVLMVVWDVALDPAMNEAFPFWTYDIPEGAGVFTAGLFFGMPLVNWAGWLLTSALIAVVYEVALGGLDRAPGPFVRTWAPPLYALNLLFPIAVCFLYGLPWAGVVGLVALAAVMLALRQAEARREGRSAPIPV